MEIDLPLMPDVKSILSLAWDIRRARAFLKVRPDGHEVFTEDQAIAMQSYRRDYNAATALHLIDCKTGAVARYDRAPTLPGTRLA